jgi:hypothetical protein
VNVSLQRNLSSLGFTMSFFSRQGMSTMSHSTSFIELAKGHRANSEYPRAYPSHVTLSLPSAFKPRIPSPFVAKSGGNPPCVPDFLASNYNCKVPNVPDVVSSLTWKESFDLRGFGDGELWKQAFLEGLGTSLLVWLTGVAAYSLIPAVS